MRAACTCFSSMLQEPRCRILYMLKGNLPVQPISVASIWSQNLHTLRSRLGSRFSFELVGSNACGASPRESNTGRWKQQPLTTKVERKSNKIRSSKTCMVRPDDLLDGTVTVGTKLNLYKSEVRESKDIKHCDVQLKVEESRKVEPLVTIFVFDLETTGFRREEDRTVEIAFRDLIGGKNSTFQTLINPERHVPNAHIHGISTHMVNRPDVPRFADLIPILQHYVQTRKIPGAPVLLVAHNARSFDVPFLINEFSRCNVEIPSDWLFLDTLPLARELVKLEGPKVLSGTSVQALREFYEIPLVGAAHSAMSDVNTLSEILRHMTIDLKLPVSALLERSFKASDVISVKKKKKNMT
ncbi:Exonuclease [Macleaya cordata]|uniref:Exonuclease n=1 Tax=Macleaya cordata TaxID=56857 RepID=A0A200PWI4_MACCD|nr:Exonuclease [Macleaya cordata]